MKGSFENWVLWLLAATHLQFCTGTEMNEVAGELVQWMMLIAGKSERDCVVQPSQLWRVDSATQDIPSRAGLSQLPL